MKGEELDKNIDILVDACNMYIDIGLCQSTSTTEKKTISKYFLNGKKNINY